MFCCGCWKQWLAQDGDSRAEHAGRFFSSCIPFHTTTSPFPKKHWGRLCSALNHSCHQNNAEQQTARQNNRRHTTAVWPPGTSLIIKEEWHVEERGCGRWSKSPSYKFTNQLINLRKTMWAFVGKLPSWGQVSKKHWNTIKLWKSKLKVDF